MTKLCPNCKKVQIDEKYIRCATCNETQKQESGDRGIVALEKIAQQLEYINWNFGTFVSLLKGDKKTLKKIQEAVDEAQKNNGGEL